MGTVEECHRIRKWHNRFQIAAIPNYDQFTAFFGSASECLRQSQLARTQIKIPYLRQKTNVCVLDSLDKLNNTQPGTKSLPTFVQRQLIQIRFDHRHHMSIF